MNNFLKNAFLVFVVFGVLLVALGAINVFTTSIDNKNTYKHAYRWTGKPKDKLLDWAQEVENRLDGTTGNQSFYFDPTDTVPTASEGRLYYNESGKILKLYTGVAAGWVDVDKAGASSLDSAYDAGSAITVDGSTITCTAGLATNNGVLSLIQSNTGAYECLKIANAGTDPSIEIDGSGTGDDITGTGDTWTISEAGVASLVGIVVTTEDLELENGAEIQNSTDTEIKFIEDNGSDDEDVSWDFTANTLTWKSSSGVATMGWGDVDTHTGIDDLQFDVGGTSNAITCAGSGTGKDLTIEQTVSGADASLILQSTGTSTSDALSLISSVGSTKINSADNLDIDAADNITIDTADGSFTLTVGGGTDGDMTISVADAITITSTDSAQNGIHIEANGGTSESINLYSNQGTGASATTEHDASIQLQSDAGGISLYTTGNVADAIRIEANGGTSETITVLSVKGTGTSSVDIDSTVGGITIQTHAAGKDVDIDSVLGSIYIVAEENDACAVWIEADGSTASAVRIHNDTGTAASATTESDASIQLFSDAGGIGLFSSLNGANAIRIEADGGGNETVAISSVKGTGVASIDIDSTVGGITISANAAGKDINIDSVSGSIYIVAEEDDPCAIWIESDGSTASGIGIHNDTGTAAAAATESDASIQLHSDVGGIGLLSNLNKNDAIRIEANGGTSANIAILNNQGTDANSIEIISDDGGITITAGKPVVITNAFEPDIVHIPDATTYTVLANNSGQDHLWPNLTADCNVTMVAEADGLHYRFIYVGGAADAQDWAFNTQNDTNFYKGGLVHHDEDGELTACVYSDESDDSVLTILTPMAGTVVEMWCDGTNWFVTGTVISATNTAIVFVEQ